MDIEKLGSQMNEIAIFKWQYWLDSQAKSLCHSNLGDFKSNVTNSNGIVRKIGLDWDQARPPNYKNYNMQSWFFNLGESSLQGVLTASGNLL